MTDDAFWRVGETLAAGVVGFLASVATFRGRFVGIERDVATASALARDNRAADIKHLERELERVRKECDDGISRLAEILRAEHDERKEYRRNMARRQMAILQLVADIANKAGVTNRALDVLPRLLAEDEGI